jgi:prevent-host-death family protein
MATIPQRELRNQISAVLRRAEQGEHFIVTVGGRPVAELGPLRTTLKPAPPEALRDVFAVPVDAGWAAELREMREADEAAARESATD